MIAIFPIAEAASKLSFFHGGEFFTQLTFTAMATIVFSSRVVDFLVIEKNESAEKLRSNIQAELDKGLIFEEQNQQYTETHKQVEDLIKQIDASKFFATVICRILAAICMGLAFLLLITGKDEHTGCIPLLAFVPIGVARWVLIWRLKGINARLGSKKEIFNALQVAYNAKTRKAETQADSSVEIALQKREPTTSRREAPNTPATAAAPRARQQRSSRGKAPNAPTTCSAE